jgi:hypothetical protein
MERLMPLLAPTALAETLRETNVRLSYWLDSLIPDPATPDTPHVATPHSATAHAATPELMAGLLSELMSAGQKLRALPSERDAALDAELSEYRKNVERLRTVLPSIHGTLLRERARLEQERKRVESAAAWACGSRQTL